MSAHTPGPWIRDGLTVYALMTAGWRRGVEMFKNRFSALVQCDRECSKEEAEANARLIAAAPELLTELDECRKFLEDMHCQPAEITVAESQARHSAVLAVIAKATGAQP